MPASSSFPRQLSQKEPSKSTSKRWVGGGSKRFSGNGLPCGCEQSLSHMEGFTGCGLTSSSSPTMRKRVMVVVDHKSRSKHAMMWALTHVANKGDLLTLLHVIPPGTGTDPSHCSPYLASSLGSLCKASKPEVSLSFYLYVLKKCLFLVFSITDFSVLSFVKSDHPTLRSCSPFLTCLVAVW